MITAEDRAVAREIISPDQADQDLIDARILIDHLKWFSTDENKATWLALILRSRRSEIQYQAGMNAVRGMMGENTCGN